MSKTDQMKLLNIAMRPRVFRTVFLLFTAIDTTECHRSLRCGNINFHWYVEFERLPEFIQTSKPRFPWSKIRSD